MKDVKNHTHLNTIIDEMVQKGIDKEIVDEFAELTKGEIDFELKFKEE